MDTNLLFITTQIIIALIALVSIILATITIVSTRNLNQKTLFTEIVKQERNLRIKLLEYKEIIDNKKLKKGTREGAELDYDTLLFNYYEFFAVCIFKEIIDEKETKLLFREYLKSVKELFEKSILFKEEYAEKRQYKVLQWLFKEWKI